jgi:hypothetical protein
MSIPDLRFVTSGTAGVRPLGGCACDNGWTAILLDAAQLLRKDGVWSRTDQWASTWS